MTAGDEKALLSAMGTACTTIEAREIRRLVVSELPPVTSLNALAVMTGFSPSFLWSMMHRKINYYRIFTIPKGRSMRFIESPKVSLKFIQKWISLHFERKWEPHFAVHGFVKKRSHISAAAVHLNAEWVISVDINNFFPSTNESVVRTALQRLGYRSVDCLDLLANICCFDGRLPQGAPSSPVLSNIALHDVDCQIAHLAQTERWRFTRYADDIVISGTGALPTAALKALEDIFAPTCWSLSPEKVFVAQLPQRLKVHGLLVHGNRLRLTKGYRNRIRAYKHLQQVNKIREGDKRFVEGHLNYARQIDAREDTS